MRPKTLKKLLGALRLISQHKPINVLIEIEAMRILKIRIQLGFHALICFSGQHNNFKEVSSSTTFLFFT